MNKKNNRNSIKKKNIKISDLKSFEISRFFFIIEKIISVFKQKNIIDIKLKTKTISLANSPIKYISNMGNILNKCPISLYPGFIRLIKKLLLCRDKNSKSEKELRSNIVLELSRFSIHEICLI